MEISNEEDLEQFGRLLERLRQAGYGLGGNMTETQSVRHFVIFRGGIDAIIHHDARYLYKDAIGGAISGGVKTLLNNAIFGATFVRKESYGVNSYQRSGGLASLLSFGAGLTMGNNCWIYDRDKIDVSNHEDYHVIQQNLMEGGWADFYGKIVYEYLKYGFNNSL